MKLSKDQLAAVHVASGTEVRVIAAATAPTCAVAVTPESWCFAGEDGRWSVVGWESVATGAWDQENTRLTWRLADGSRHEAVLPEPGRVPESFRERVQASTVLLENHDLEPGWVEIIARRSLDHEGRIQWFATAGGGASLADPEVAAYVVARTDELREEYHWD